MKKCDHKSVGIFVWNDDKLLLIERAKFPYGFAVPAGHVDGDSSFEVAAKRELKEEVDLDAESLDLLLEEHKENPCRREDGTWHDWKLFKVSFKGEINRSLDETKKVSWYSMDQIIMLAQRTEQFNAGKISDSEWQENPGLEPVMYEFFKELKIV